MKDNYENEIQEEKSLIVKKENVFSKTFNKIKNGILKIFNVKDLNKKYEKDNSLNEEEKIDSEVACDDELKEDKKEKFLNSIKISDEQEKNNLENDKKDKLNKFEKSVHEKKEKIQEGKIEINSNNFSKEEVKRLITMYTHENKVLKGKIEKATSEKEEQIK